MCSIIVASARLVEVVRMDVVDLDQLEPLRVAHGDALAPEAEDRVAALLGGAAVAQP